MAYSSGTLFYCSLTKEVYNPKAFFLRAALLGQTCVHCPIFPTAASRRSLDRISVPMWPFNLSVRLPIVDLVGRYPANYLIGRKLISVRCYSLAYRPCKQYALCGISNRFRLLSPSQRQIAHALLTSPPLSNLIIWPKPQSQALRSTCMC